MKISTPLKGQQGSALILAMIAAGVLGILSLAFASSLQSTQQATVRINTQVSAAIVRSNIQAIIENEISWTETLAVNPTLQCVRTFSDCSSMQASANAIPILKNSAGTTLFDQSISTNGFGVDGAPCDTFNVVNPDLTCPFRLSLTWRPTCPASGPCIGAPLEIVGRLEVSQNLGFPFNPNNYLIRFSR